MMTFKRKNIFQKFIQYSLFSMLVLVCNIGYAGIYKWLDAEGNTHYGQQRPTNATSERMQVQKYAPENTSTYNRPGTKKTDATADDSTAEQPEKSQEPELQAETKAEKKRRLAGCAEARKRLSTMQSIGRIRSVDKDGNYRYLSQKEKESRINKNKKSISKHCK